MGENKSQFTEYGGRIYRSKTEAQYASVFDAIGVPVQYERETFDTPAGRYVPDFYIESTNSFIEIKGENGQMVGTAETKVRHLAGVHDGHVYVMINTPRIRPFRDGLYLCDFGVFAATTEGWENPIRGQRLDVILAVAGIHTSGKTQRSVIMANAQRNLASVNNRIQTLNVVAAQSFQAIFGWNRLERTA